MYDLESTGSSFSFTPQQETTQQLPKHVQQRGIMLVSKEVVFLRDYLSDVRVQQSSAILSFSFFIYSLTCASGTRANPMIFKSNLHF